MNLPEGALSPPPSTRPSKMALVDRGPCPLCGGADRKVFLNFSPSPVVECGDCHFLFSKFVRAPEAIIHEHVENYGGLRHMQGQEVNALFNIRVLKKMGVLSRARTLLDVGSGYGYLPWLAKREFNIDARGCELSKEEAEYAHDKLGIVTYADLGANCGVDVGSMDVVSTFEVIEHTVSPLDFLKEISAFVKPGGLLIVVTDNFRSGVVQSLGAEFPKWIPHEHISHFDSTSLIKAAASLPGFQVELQRSFTPWEHSLRRLVTSFRKKRTEAETYNLDFELATEMSRGYRLYGIRKWLNPLWAPLSLRNDLQGELMYLVLRKGAV